jgi:hypothetical protein
VKNYGCFVPAFACCGLALFSVTYSCPMFVEFYPDPKDVSDKEGEYVEILLDDFRAESLFVRFESKAVLSFAWPDAERLVLVHDSSQCQAVEPAATVLLNAPPDSLHSSSQSELRGQDAPKSVACGSLGNTTLPNSRESAWKLWAGTCVDSVTVPRPKPGKVIQRVGMTDEWTFVDRAFGAQDNKEQDSLLVARMFAGGTSLLRVTEVHHCPEEPMPEWVELHNASAYALPLDAFRFCDRGGALGLAGDSIRPFQTVLVSKDTSSLRTVLGIPDIRLVQVSLGFLNNVEGTLRLCFRNDVIDSVYWNKAMVSCPSGFNPLTNRREYTPGFLPRSAQSKVHANASNRLIEYKLSSRVVSKKGAPLRVRVESENDVTVSLLDSAGRRVWKSVASAMSNEWVKIPVQEYLGIGVGFVALSVGEYEDVVGILVRP